MGEIQILLPAVITREGNWFVASCPLIDVATQGETEEEVKENMGDLISDFMNDPDTQKPELSALMTTSLTNIPVRIPERMLHGKAQALTTA